VCVRESVEHVGSVEGDVIGAQARWRIHGLRRIRVLDQREGSSQSVPRGGRRRELDVAMHPGA
jgi:hypothetical protein